MRTALFTLMIVVATTASACIYRPVRFADAPPVDEVADDAPIRMPPRSDPVLEFEISEAYLRRPLLDALDPLRNPEPGDVNARDEVPSSSWFDPRSPGTSDGPPVPPFTLLTTPPSSTREAIAVVDARGLPYELRRDTPERPEMSTAAAVVASRVLRAIGYRTPEAHVLDIAQSDLVPPKGGAPPMTPAAFLNTGPPAVHGRYRVGALRWPVGVDIGPTKTSGKRADDPNDRVDHIDRRTMRALTPALFWVGISWLSIEALRDAYVGPPGKGHVNHYVVALDGALGSDVTERRDDAKDPYGTDFLLTLGMFGLEPRGRRVQPDWPMLGDYTDIAAPSLFAPSPPFDPRDRMGSPDVYWMAKRIAAVPDSVLQAAVDAAHISDARVRARALHVLVERRTRLIAWGDSLVTPCEVQWIEPGAVVLRDEAIARAAARAEETRYAITYLDQEGREVAKRATVSHQATTVSVPIPPGTGYLVVRIRVERERVAAPRAMEVHIVRDAKGARLVGVRH